MHGMSEVAALRPLVRVATSSGSIRVVGEERTDVVSDHGTVDVRGSEVCVTTRSSTSVEVRCPAGADVVAGSSSGSIRLEGRLGDVRATTSSGKITVERAAAADLRSSSGSLRVGWCDGAVRAATSSGTLRVDRAGAVDGRLTSGDARVTAGRIDIRGVGADVEATSTGGDVEVRTVSGTVTVTVPAGARPALDLRARKASVEVDEGDDLRVEVRSVSGKVTVRES